MSILKPNISIYEASALRLNSNVVLYPKFGQNQDVDAVTAPEDIILQGGTYAGFPITNGETVSVVSTSANDTAAGTGVRRVRLFGLNANWTRQVEDVTLNGTTPVTTTGVWTRLTFVKPLSAGSGETNAGTITVAHTTTTANIFAVLTAGSVPSQIAAFTTENNYTGIIRNLSCAISNNGASSQEAQLVVATREFGASVWEHQRQLIVATGSQSFDPTDVMIVVPPRTDVKVRCVAATADNLRMVARFDMLTVQGVY